MKKIIALIVVFTFYSTSIAQSFNIVKIIDSNLFELSNGRKVKLSGLDVPPLNSYSENFSFVALEAFHYAKNNLLNKQVEILEVGRNKKHNYSIVILHKNDPLEKVNVNQVYLEHGYGKLIMNVPAADSLNFLQFQKNAIDNNVGIWGFYNGSNADTLDFQLTVNSKGIVVNKFYVKGEDIILPPRPLYYSIPLEIGAGALAIIPTSFLIGGLVAALTQGSILTGPVGITFGVFIGFPTGAYLVAKRDNPDLSYLVTVSSSLGLTLLTGGISAWIESFDENHWAQYLIALSPIIGTLAYIHLLAPTPVINNDISSNIIQPNKIKTLADLYNNSMNFRMELIHINF